MTAIATKTACQACRWRALRDRPLVNARNNGTVPIGSMMTSSVTKTSVNSLVWNAKWCTPLNATDSELLGRCGQSRRERPKLKIEIGHPVAHVTERQVVIHQHAGRRRPHDGPQPQSHR